MNLDRIPHIYHNTIYIKKLFEIIYEKHLNIRKMFDELALFNDIDKSNGYLLDILGGNFKVLRNGLSDQEYRKKIKFTISSLQFMGTLNEIKKILATYFQMSKNDFFVSELSGKIIIKVPNIVLKEEIYESIKKIKTAGVGLQVDFEIYIEDYTIAELEKMSLDEITKITIARR